MTGLLVFIAVAVLTQSLTYQYYLISTSNASEQVNQEANNIKEKLQHALRFSLAATKTLAFIVEQHGVPDNFESVAKSILESNQYIDALQLTNLGVITHVYPLHGNERAIGFDILGDSLTRKEALHALNTRTLFFAGPFELRQGGKAIVGRIPMFRDDQFLGFSVVLIKLQTLLAAAEIYPNPSSKFVYQLSKVNPLTNKEEFFLPDVPSNVSRHGISMEIPDGKWTLYVTPKDANGTVLGVLGFAFLGLVLSFIAGLFGWHVMRQPLILNSLVDKRTKQLNAEKVLSESIINALPGVFYLYDRQGKFMRWNNNFETVSGYSSSEIKKMHPLEFFSGDDATSVALRIEEVFETGSADVIAKFSSKSGSKISYYFNGRKVVFAEKEYLIGMGIDITDRVEAEHKLMERNEEIQQLTAHLDRIQEEVRTRIAREIHDELGQQLTGLKMDAAWISKRIQANDQAVLQRLSTMIGLIDETVKTVRRIASELRPGILDDLGLLPALEWQCQEFERRTGLPCAFHLAVDHFNPDRAIATNVFRIFQEALTNIARHADATQVKTSVEEIGNFVQLVIQDDGRGMNLREASKKNSLGLVGMRERALLFNGELTIESQPDHGTKVTLKIPV